MLHPYPLLAFSCQYLWFTHVPLCPNSHSAKLRRNCRFLVAFLLQSSSLRSLSTAAIQISTARSLDSASPTGCQSTGSRSPYHTKAKPGVMVDTLMVSVSVNIVGDPTDSHDPIAIRRFVDNRSHGASDYDIPHFSIYIRCRVINTIIVVVR